jgi:hypothetical protein
MESSRVRYSSFSAALVDSGFRRLGSFRNSGTGLGPGAESKDSSGTNADEDVGADEDAGAGEVEIADGDVDDEVLRPVRLSHLDA